MHCLVPAVTDELYGTCKVCLDTIIEGLERVKEEDKPKIVNRYIRSMLAVVIIHCK